MLQVLCKKPRIHVRDSELVGRLRCDQTNREHPVKIFRNIYVDIGGSQRIANFTI